jgi:hypothetical protein
MSDPLGAEPYDPYAGAYGPYGLIQIMIIPKYWFLLWLR